MYIRDACSYCRRLIDSNRTRVVVIVMALVCLVAAPAGLASDLPETWGEPVNGLALGIVASSDEHSILFAVYLKNVSTDAMALTRKSLEEAPAFIFMYSDATRDGLTSRPATLSSLAPSPSFHVPPPATEVLPPGKSKYLGDFVVGPRSVIVRWRVPRARAEMEIQVAGQETAAEKKGLVSTAKVVSNAVSVPPTQKEKQDREVQEIFQCKVLRLLLQHPDWPLDQILVTIVSDRGEKPLIRGFAGRSLADLKAPSGVGALMQLASDEEDPFQPHAVFFLGLAGDPAAVPLLMKLCGDARTAVRAGAAGGLGRLGAVSAVPRLVALLKQDPDAAVRENAARALGELGGHEALTALNEALGAEQHHNVAYNIILALQRLKDPSSVRPLLEFIRDWVRPEWSIVRSTAAQAIDSITGQEFKGDIVKIERWLEAR